MVKRNLFTALLLIGCLGYLISSTTASEYSDALDALSNSSPEVLLYKKKDKKKAKKEIKKGVQHAVHGINKGKHAALRSLNKEIKSAKKHDLDHKKEYVSLGKDYVKQYMNEAKHYVKSGAQNGIDAVSAYAELENSVSR